MDEAPACVVRGFDVCRQDWLCQPSFEICAPRPWTRGRTSSRCRLSLELIFMHIISQQYFGYQQTKQKSWQLRQTQLFLADWLC